MAATLCARAATLCARAVLFMADTQPRAKVFTMVITAAGMPFVGRG